jgi:hypothetical protein
MGAEPHHMRPPIRSLREYAALAVLAALVAAVGLTTLAATTVIGGGPGIAAGIVFGAATAQLLRRPAGNVIGYLVDA